jgi:hypothetical protein
MCGLMGSRFPKLAYLVIVLVGILGGAARLGDSPLLMIKLLRGEFIIAVISVKKKGLLLLFFLCQ